MKFYKFYYMTDWKWFFIIPTIVIVKDEQMYMNKNLSVQFHWIGFHFKWFWTGKENK